MPAQGVGVAPQRHSSGHSISPEGARYGEGVDAMPKFDDVDTNNDGVVDRAEWETYSR